MFYISTLDNHLKKFNCMQGLIEIGRLSKDLYKLRKPFDIYPIKINGFTDRQTITQWGLSFLAYRLILVSNDGKSQELNWHNLAKAHVIFGELDEDIETDKDKISFLLRMAQEQFWWQDFSLPLYWSRYHLIYNSDPFYSAYFKKISGLTLEEYFKLGLIFSFIISEYESPVLNMKQLQETQFPFNTDHIFSEQILGQFLHLISAHYNTIRYEARKINTLTIPKYEKYEFNPMHKYPIIKGDNRFPYYGSFQYVVPNIMLLLRRVAHGVYWDFRDYFFRLKSDEFLLKFGDSYENYCGNILSQYFGCDRVLKVKDLVGEDHINNKHADWILLEDDNVYIFECKSSLLPIIARRTFRPSHIESWIRRNLVYANSQLDNTIELLEKNGILKDKNAHKFIILLEELYIADDKRIKSAIMEHQFKSLIKSYSDVHIISIFELEKMENVIQKHSFAEILTKKLEIEKRDDLLVGGNFLTACKLLDENTKLYCSPFVKLGISWIYES